MTLKKITALLFLLTLKFTVSAQQPIRPSALDSLNNIKDSVELNVQLKTLFEGSEKDLLMLLTYYKNSPELLDSVMRVGTKKFPTGIIAFAVLYSKIATEEDPVALEKLLSKWEDFPDFNVHEANSFRSLSYAKSKDAAKALTYLDKLQGINRRNRVIKVLLITKDYDWKSSETFILTELKNEKYSYEERLLLQDVYAQILIKKGDYKNAFISIQEVFNQTTKRSPELEANYYYLLSKTGGHSEAFPKLVNIAESGVANEELLTELKRVYKILYPKKNANEYFSALSRQLEDSRNKLVLTSMINEPAPNFKIKDLNGKDVSLTDFTGKTIVLDFWATWCIPCKKSLPAMQMVVDKYKDVSDVKFLFIHTLEDVPDPKTAASKYLKLNNFRLPLYLDLRDLSSKKSPAVTAFKVLGIPAKFVIDGQGNIRFKVNGYNQDLKSAVAELSTMIELARE